MQVRKRLRLTGAFSVITAFVVLLMLLLTLSRIRLAAEESDSADDLIVSSFERSAFREDYLRTDSERAKIQWFAKHKEIGKFLKTLSEKSRDPQDKKMINEMIKDQESTGKLFSEIVDNREKAASGARSAEVSQEIENRLTAQINMRLYGKILNGRRLRDAAEERLFSTLRFAGWCILFVIGAVVLAVAINSWTVGRTIVNQMKLIRGGVANIGSGDLDYRIHIKGEDEFVELAESFNAMAAKLQRSYSDIGKEIAERKRAEAFLTADLFALTRIHDLSRRALETEGIQPLLQEVVEAAVAIMGADKGTLRLFEGDSLRIAAHLGHKQSFLDFFASDENRVSVCGAAMECRDRVIVPDVETSPLFAGTPSLAVLREAGVRAVQSTPMMSRTGALLGILTTQWGFAYSPDEHDLLRLDLLARQAADLIQHSQAEQVLRERGEDLKNHIAELDIVNRELESFNYSISHDLRSPLRHISGLSQILLEKYSDKLDAEGKDFLFRNVNACKRMYQLTDDLLRLSRITHSEIKKEKVGLSSIAGEIADSLSQAQPERNAEFVITNDLQTEGDPDLIRILLENLFQNAWKFTAKTASARIEFGAAGDSEGQIVYYVRDNGIGFDPQHASGLFRPFQRMHNPDDFPGSGIGLAIAHRIVSKHKGRIWAESQPGEGATFYFTL